MKVKLTILFTIPFIIFNCNSNKKKETIIKVNNKDGIVLQALPQTNSYKLALIPFNSEIIILDKNGPKDYIKSIEGNWYRVEFNTTHGYIFSGFLNDIVEKVDKNKMIKIIPEITKIKNKSDEKTFRFVHLDRQYTIDNSGYLYDEANIKIIKLINKRQPIEYIEKMFYFSYNNDILLLYEITDGDSGWSKLTRFKYSNNTLKNILDVKIGGFGLTGGLVEEHYIYLATLGTIGKFDLDTGNFAWKHNDIYTKYQIEIFSEIIKNDKNIYFIEGGHNNRRKIEVNKNNGNIENIKKLL